MIQKIFLSEFGAHGRAVSAGAASANVGDSVRFIRCTDNLTGEVSHDMWVVREGSPAWSNPAICQPAIEDDLEFLLLAESEVREDAQGRLYADFYVSLSSPLAAALAAVSAAPVDDDGGMAEEEASPAATDDNVRPFLRR